MTFISQSLCPDAFLYKGSTSIDNSNGAISVNGNLPAVNTLVNSYRELFSEWFNVGDIADEDPPLPRIDTFGD